MLNSIARAISLNNAPVPDTGIATIAEFLADEAEIDGEFFTVEDDEDPQDVYEALLDSHLPGIIDTVDARPLISSAAPDHPRDDSTAAFRLNSSTGTPFSLHITLTRSDTSRLPGCWLLSMIRTIDSEPLAQPP